MNITANKNESKALFTQPTLFSELPRSGEVTTRSAKRELDRMKSSFADWQEVARASKFTMRFLTSETGQLSDFEATIGSLVRGGLHWNFDPSAKRFTAQRRNESGELGSVFEFCKV